MRILYLSSKLLQIIEVPLTLQKMGYEVAIYKNTLEDVECNLELQQQFDSFIRENAVDVLISNTFCVYAAECTCNYEIPYIVYGMDSPHYTLWQEQAKYKNVYLFQFDSRECELLRKSGYQNVWYMPLAARNADRLVINEQDIRKYRADISFVGSAYTVNVFDELAAGFPENIVDTATNIMETTAFIWDGVERVIPRLKEEVSPSWDKLYDMFRQTSTHKKLEIDKEYLLGHFLINRKLTNLERNMIFELLAENYDFRLYTREEEKVSPKIKRYGEVDADTEALKVFYSSKINLNLTLRSIERGVPLRIFDIMSVGGFVLTDYRVDAEELFEEDKDIVMYRSPEEMLEKIDYYLVHEEERKRIAYNGYCKVKQNYSYQKQLEKILEIVRAYHF